MDEQRLFSDERLGYTPEMGGVYDEARKNNIPTVRPQVGQFLSLVVDLVAPQRVLEIGTGSGYSTLWLLRYLPPGGRIVTLERDRRRYREAIALLYQKPVEVIHTDAKSFLSECEQGFDMIFLDSEKREYVELVPLLEKCLKRGGVLVVDNLLGRFLHQKRRSPLPAQEALERFYEAVHASGAFRVFAFSWEDGILVARRL